MSLASPDELAASGTTFVFLRGGAVEVVDARAGTARELAETAGALMGLSIVDRRIAWAVRTKAGVRIRTLQLR